MQFRELGNTQIQISAIGYGGWALSPSLNWGTSDDAQSRKTIRAAYDAGITFFDNAELYGDGHSETLFGDALHDVRDNIVLATKVRTQFFGRDALRKNCEASLRRLRTDRIDLFQLHWPEPTIPIDETLGILDELKREGKIRAVGVSNFGPRDLTDALATPHEFVSNQICYNLLFRAAEYEILPLCAQHGKSVLCYSPLCQGLLGGTYNTAGDVPEGRARTRHFSCGRVHARHGEAGAEKETFEAIRKLRALADESGETLPHLALNWLLQNENVASVIVGGRTPEQVRDSASALRTLPRDVYDAASRITAELKNALGANADPWQSPANSRMR